MMSYSVSNSAFQNWLLNVLEHPGSDDEAWNSTKATQHLAFDAALSNVLPSRMLTQVERIAIYRRMFYLRMTDAMEIDFPGMVHATGREQFRRLIANEYIGKYPSTSYTLNHLGKHFPKFLAESGIKHSRFLSELAGLELTITDLMDEREPEPAAGPSVESVPPASLEQARFHFIPALALLSSDYPVADYLRDVQQESEPSIPAEPKPSWTMVYRYNYEMDFRPLTKDEFDLLSSLKEGRTIGESFSSLLAHTTTPSGDLQRLVFEWFQNWMEIGIIHRIDVANSSS
jgi:hypothetical protein